MTRPLTVVPVTGLPEVTQGDDLAGLLHGALTAAGESLRPGDVLVVSSKVVSKSLGLRVAGERAEAVAAETVRVVAERATPTGSTAVVVAAAGPVMAAAGVDSSNVGPGAGSLLLPRDPDAAAADLRAALLTRSALPPETALGVVVSDTAGRPWRAGQVDFSLGCAGLGPLEDHRGGVDADGRPLSVTVRAVADEVAAAGDLVKGKVDAVPAALVRGLPLAWFAADAPGAAALRRQGPSDWFRLGHVEAVRSALGAGPGEAAAAQIGVRSVSPEPYAVRRDRAVALALLGSSGVDVGERTAWGAVLTGADPFALGVVVGRLEAAAHAESLRLVQASTTTSGAVAVHLDGPDLA